MKFKSKWLNWLLIATLTAANVYSVTTQLDPVYSKAYQLAFDQVRQARNSTKYTSPIQNRGIRCQPQKIEASFESSDEVLKTKNLLKSAQSRLKEIKTKLEGNKKAIKLLLKRKDSILKKRIELLMKAQLSDTAEVRSKQVANNSSKHIKELGNELESMDQVMKQEEQYVVRHFKQKSITDSEILKLQRKLMHLQKKPTGFLPGPIPGCQFESRDLRHFNKLICEQQNKEPFTNSRRVEKNPLILSQGLSKAAAIHRVEATHSETAGKRTALKNKKIKIHDQQKTQKKESDSSRTSDILNHSHHHGRRLQTGEPLYDSLESVSLDEALDKIKAKSAIPIPRIPQLVFHKSQKALSWKVHQDKGKHLVAPSVPKALSKVASKSGKSSQIPLYPRNAKLVALAEPVLQFRSRRGRLDGEAPVMMASKQSVPVTDLEKNIEETQLKSLQMDKQDLRL